MKFYLFSLINQFAGKNVCLDSVSIFFAEYFQYVLIFILFLFLAKNFKKYWRMVVEALVSAALAKLVITNVIRYFLPKLRPFVENNVNLLISQDPKESSFPSGHASFFFAIATVVYFYNKKAGILFFVSVFLISISRVFVGVHWPLDILAGAIVGIFSGWLIFKLAKRFLKI